MAITVNVRFHNMLCRQTGVEQEAIVLPEGVLLLAALEHLVDGHHQGLKQMLFASDGVISCGLTRPCLSQVGALRLAPRGGPAHP